MWGLGPTWGEMNCDPVFLGLWQLQMAKIFGSLSPTKLVGVLRHDRQLKNRAFLKYFTHLNNTERKKRLF
jgi:hypothetical protein